MTNCVKTQSSDQLRKTRNIDRWPPDIYNHLHICMYTHQEHVKTHMFTQFLKCNENQAQRKFKNLSFYLMFVKNCY